MIGFGLNHTNEPSNPGHNIMRVHQQQQCSTTTHQFDPYASKALGRAFDLGRMNGRAGSRLLRYTDGSA